MSDLVAIAFPAEAKAEEVRQKLMTMQKEHLIDLGDVVIALRESDGHIKLNRLISTTAAGAVGGAFWGALIDDKWMKETAASIKPGTAALFALVRKFTTSKVLDAREGEGGTVLKTSLDHTTEAALQRLWRAVVRLFPRRAYEHEKDVGVCGCASSASFAAFTRSTSDAS